MDDRVLIVEDHPEIADLVAMHLADQGIALERAEDGESGLSMARDGGYGLIILDLMLPGMGGLEVCKRLRARGDDVAILMLTAKSEEFDKVLGLELGADDYLTKPFSVRELVARVKALLRRRRGHGASPPPEAAPAAPEPLEFGGLSIDLAKRRVSLGGETVALTAKEFDLLALFATHPGMPFTREQLLDKVWGYSYSGYEHTVNSHINRLRRKIERNPSEPRYILTVWGYGYRFMDREEAAS